MVTHIHFRNLFLHIAKVLVAVVICSMSLVWAAEVEAQLDRESVPAGNGAVINMKNSSSRAAVNADYKKIIDALNKSCTEQAASGFLAAFHGTVATVSNIAGAIPTTQVAKKNQNYRIGLNTISHQINGNKVEFYGTDAAILGQGAYYICLCACIVILVLLSNKLYKFLKSKSTS